MIIIENKIYVLLNVCVFCFRSKPELTKQPACRSGGCRVCLKSFKDGDYSRVCFGCKFKVCEDCATSYTKIDENQDEVSMLLVTTIAVHTRAEVKEIVVDFYP